MRLVRVFSDRLKCAIVLSRSPGPIRTYLRVQNCGDYGALRNAHMNFLVAEDDSNGPVPMKLGAMKGSCKKGEKGYGQGNYGKSFGKYDKNNDYNKNNEYGKGHENVKKKFKKGKGKGQGKDERPAPNSSFQGSCRSCGEWGTRRASVGKVTSKEWRRFRVLPRVHWRRVQRPHLQLRRRQRPFKEVNDENESGWIFGMVVGSVASVTTER